jgi:predicted nuclease of predicted toxin-antitoxin system
VAERLRFHFDENCHPSIARSLRRHGVDVTTALEAGLRTQSDAAQLAFARRERRVIVTGDADFLRLARQGAEHPGIIFYSPHKPIGEVVRRLILIYELITPEEMTGHVEFI